MAKAVRYRDYPKQLEHPQGGLSDRGASRLPPIIVYDSEQEEEYLAKGYAPAGAGDPHAFLIATITPKIDDAMRRVTVELESKFAALRDTLMASIATLPDEIMDSVSDKLSDKLSIAVEDIFSGVVKTQNELHRRFSLIEIAVQNGAPALRVETFNEESLRDEISNKEL